MAMEHSVLEPAGVSTRHARRPGEEEAATGEVTASSRLWRQLVARRHDDGALGALLAGVDPMQRHRTLLALIGVVGGERAQRLGQSAWGQVPALLGTEEVEAAVSEAEVASFDLALARSVRETVAVLVERGHERRHEELVNGLMDQLPPNVADAAATLLRGDAGLRAAGTMATSRRSVSPVGQGPGAALFGATERHAGTLMRKHASEPGSSGARATGERGGSAPGAAAVDEALRDKGAGQPLPEALRVELEARFGVRLDGVRLHTDEVAARAAQAISAHAFTLGQDIFFAAGAFAPSTEAGQRLLAHEVTHVVQAYQGRVPQGGERRVSLPDEPLEREAEGVATGRGSMAPSSTASPAAPGAAPTAGSSPVAFRGGDGGSNTGGGGDGGADAQGTGAAVTTGVIKFEIGDVSRSEPEISGKTLVEFADKWNAATGKEGTSGALFFVKPSVTGPTGYKYDKDKGVQEASVKITWTWKVPKWKEGTANPGNFHKKEIQAYTEARNTMVAHEDGHVAIDKATYVDSALEAHRGKKEKEFVDGLNEITTKGDTDNKAYDDKTGHGVNQGGTSSTHLRIPNKQELE